jgi:hypothetical protein
LANVRSRIPASAKAVVRPGLFAGRRLTSRVRALPDFVIIGAQRCGTTSLYDSLTGHRAVFPAAGKELHFFDLNWERGEHWYRSRFPVRERMSIAQRVTRVRSITGEATPYYLFHPLVPQRAFETIPSAKLLVLLRDPVPRAYSHYLWMRRHGFETLPFEDAVRKETSRLEPEIERMADDPTYQSAAHRNFSYLARGRYAEQLRRWLEFFSREQILIVRSEDLFAQPNEAMAEILGFLELPPDPAMRYPHLGAQQYAEGLDGHVREFLVEYFSAPNSELADLVGRDFAWSHE